MFGGDVPPVSLGAATVYVTPEIQGGKTHYRIVFLIQGGNAPPALLVADPMLYSILVEEFSQSRAHGWRELDEGLLWSIDGLSGMGKAAIEAFTG